MVLSTTTAGSSPKENYDFFPLTVDVKRRCTPPQDPGLVLPP